MTIVDLRLTIENQLSAVSTEPQSYSRAKMMMLAKQGGRQVFSLRINIHLAECWRLSAENCFFNRQSSIVNLSRFFRHNRASR